MPWKFEEAQNNDVSISKFLGECPERVAVNAVPCCGLVGEMTGIAVQIGPVQCGRCRLHGSINPEYPRRLSLDLLIGKLQLAVEGHYTDRNAVILDLADKALALGKDTDPHRQYIHDALYNLITLGRVEHLSIEHLLLVKHKYSCDHEVMTRLQEAKALRKDFIARGVAVPQPMPIAIPCAGCGADDAKAPTMWEKASAAWAAAAHVVAAVAGEKIDHKQFSERKAICEACTATDSAGERLYRMATPMRPLSERPHCGVPALANLVRNQKIDGCGCMLEVKWGAEHEACPLGKW